MYVLLPAASFSKNFLIWCELDFWEQQHLVQLSRPGGNQRHHGQILKKKVIFDVYVSEQLLWVSQVVFSVVMFAQLKAH